MHPKFEARRKQLLEPFGFRVPMPPVQTPEAWETFRLTGQAPFSPVPQTVIVHLRLSDKLLSMTEKQSLEFFGDVLKRNLEARER